LNNQHFKTTTMENNEPKTTDQKKQEIATPVKKFILNGKEYEGQLIVTTRMRIPFWQKIATLFKSHLIIEHYLYLHQKTPTDVGSNYFYKFMTKAEYDKMTKR